MIVKCPHCGFEEDAPEEYIGETAICDSCQGEYVVGGVVVPASSFDEQGNATIECPYCHAQNRIKREYVNRNVRCCECDGKYHIQAQKQNIYPSEQMACGAKRASHQEACPPQQEDEYVRFEDIKLLSKITPGHILSANGKSLLRFALKLPLGISKPIVVMCNNCKRFDVVLVKAGDWQIPLCCECGKTFLVREGRSVFLSEIGRINTFKTREEEISSLYGRFKTEEQIFEGDWAAFIDPKSNLRIERIKGNIERLYKRLQISESERLIASHDKQTGAIIAFTNNWNSTLATVGGLISLMSNIDKEQTIGKESMSLNERLNQNENILNYYYDLVEEFTGVDKPEAKHCRMKTRTGYSNANELPCLWSEQDAIKCADIAEKVAYYVLTTIRRIMMKSVIYAVIITSLMVVSMMVAMASFSIDLGVRLILLFVALGSITIMLWLIIWFCSDYMDKLTDAALHVSDAKSLSGW